MPHVGYSLDVGSEIKKQKEDSAERAQDVLSDERPRADGEERTPRHAPPHGGLSVLFSHFTKYRPFLILLFLVMVTFWSLSRTADIPVIDERARDLVENQFRYQITTDVNTNFPLLAYNEKVSMINKRLYEAAQSDAFDKAVRDVVARYKSWYRDDQGQTYLFTPDSYYWYRLARNIEENGHVGTIIKEGIPFDELRNAPDGDIPTASLMPYALVAWHKLWRFANSGVSLETSTFYFSVFMGVLSVCVVFLIARKVAGDLAGLFAGFVIAIHPLFVLFNYGGYADTQVIVFFLSSLIMLVALLAAEWRWWSLIAGIVFFPLMYVLRHTWAGWYFIFIVVALSAVIYVAVLLIQHAVKTKKWFYYVLLVMLAGLVVYTGYWFSSTVYFKQTLVRIGISDELSLFPTGFKSVLELRSIGSLNRLVGVLGGLVVMVVFAFQFGVMAWENAKNRPKFSEVVLVVWALLLLVPGFRAIRFLYFFLPPFAAIVGMGCARVVHVAPDLLRHFQMDKNVRVVKWLVGAGLLLLLAVFIQEDVLTQSSSFPAAHDAMADAARWLVRNTASNSIIASWWDFGYFWESAARRPTMFDGGLFTTEYLYWVAKVLNTNRPSLAEGILHSAACGERGVLKGVYGENPNAHAALLEKFLDFPVDKVVGDSQLGESFTRTTLERSRCVNPRDTFVVLTKDMLYKIGLFRLYGQWDFEAARYKAEVSNLSQSQAMTHLVDTHGFTEEQAAGVLYRILEQEEASPGTVQISRLSKCPVLGNRLVCDNKFEVDLAAMDARQNKAHPKSLVVVKDGKRVQRVYNDTTATFAVVVFDDGDEWRSLLMDVDVADTLVVRMFIGEDIPYFKKVFQSKETPDRVMVYQAAFRNESFSNVSVNVSLTRLAMEYFYQNVHAASEYNSHLMLTAAQKFTPTNISELFALNQRNIEKTVFDFTNHTNVSVDAYVSEIKKETEAYKRLPELQQNQSRLVWK
ncbi:hypothetical protein HY490_05760 [Candidatus Woesearchaeota archaeon]|nr:hypothetical protein [Candidatus Woesearchaeota archaeon]